MGFSLEQHLAVLVLRQNFYGQMASSLGRVCRPGLGTMAVGIKDGKITLYYDPEFVQRLPSKAVRFVLEHEVSHVLRDHIPRYHEILSMVGEARKGFVTKWSNVAMDAAINNDLRTDQEGLAAVNEALAEMLEEQHPNRVPDPRDGLVLPEKWGLSKEGGYETYLAELLQQAQGQQGQGQGEGEGQGQGQGQGEGEGQGQGQGQGPGQDPKGATTHDLWSGENGDEVLSPAQISRLRETAKAAIRQAMRAAQPGRGTLPGDLLEWLEEYLAEPVIPWWTVFTEKARASRLTKLERSMRVANKALMALSETEPGVVTFPGRQRDQSWRVFFYVDTSGSMSTEALQIAKNELQHMLNADDNIQIRYMEGDVQTHTDLLLGFGDQIPREAAGRGGTDFDEYFRYMGKYNEGDTAPDIVIVYTDGYAPSVKEEFRLPPDVPVIWLMTPHHSDATDNYGEIIVCDPAHNNKY